MNIAKFQCCHTYICRFIEHMIVIVSNINTENFDISFELKNYFLRAAKLIFNFYNKKRIMAYQAAQVARRCVDSENQHLGH